MPKQSDDPGGEWWNGWWAEDFSWDGLARKPVGKRELTDKDGKRTVVVRGGHHGERTLQDYWRRDPATGDLRSDDAMSAAGELVVAPDGSAWHVAHVPLKWRDGAPAKGAWDDVQRARLAAILGARLSATAGATGATGASTAEAPDARAQFVGTVMLAAPMHPAGPQATLHLNCDHAWLAWFVAKSKVFGEDLSFKAACFSGAASFEGAQFLGTANFHSSIFVCFSAFYFTKFLDYSSFIKARFYAAAHFYGAKFSQYARFDEAHFSEVVTFERSRFDGEGYFVGAVFLQEVRFDESIFVGYTNFASAKFCSTARFLAAKFFDGAFFYMNKFDGEVLWADAQLRHARFEQVDFTSEVIFRGVKFGAGTPASGNKFGGRFHRCRFAGAAGFQDVSFHDFLDFSASTFAGPVWFTGITWPKSAEGWHAAFDQSVFRDIANFRGSGFGHFAAFDGAAFQGGLQLDETDEVTANATFAGELAEAKTMDGMTPAWAWQPSALLASWLTGKAALSYASPAALRQLERGCRVLKQAMEKASHKTQEQMLHAFELQARRSQRGTPGWEKLVSLLYAWTSDYGRSIARPLLVLLASIPLFACVYWLLVSPQEGRSEAALFRECLGFSLERLFPISTAKAEPGSVRALLFGDGGSWANLGGRFLAALQFVFSLAMAFLSGLAIRRRFQIA